MSFRSHLRGLKRLANRGLERFWSIGFAILGRARRSRPMRWSSPGGQRVLVVAPHPDDEAIGCAGTILLHRQAGDQVCVAIATDGRRSRAIPDPDQMAAQRQREARVAASLMGIDRLAWLGLREADCSPAALKHSLFTLLEEIQPDVIYAPSRIDFHPEHLKVAHALALAIGDLVTTHAPIVRIYQIQVPLASPLCNLITDVSSVAEQCESVLAAYTSQAGSVQGAFRLRRYGALLHGFQKQAEEFWEIPASGYEALHGANAQGWPATFRGLRHFSLADPLAYLAGRAERGRLRKLVATGSPGKASPADPRMHPSI
jgi:LmbE family N-acetylglucosaminyl deacetylase